jgi:uncharacterized protein YjiS (DUF1127 family)
MRGAHECGAERALLVHCAKAYILFEHKRQKQTDAPKEMTMTTNTELKLEQLPYGYEASLVSDLIALPGKLFASLGKLIDALDEAVEMRNRYLELDGLNDAALKNLGIARETIPQVVAREAGLIEAVATPVAHNTNTVPSIRPAA